MGLVESYRKMGIGCSRALRVLRDTLKHCADGSPMLARAGHLAEVERRSR